MKPSAVLINCARGELIDESALATALNESRIAGAGIDVYSKEPPTDNPLLTAKNTVLTPHLGASTIEAQLAVAEEAADALLDYLRDGAIRSAVNVVGLPAQLTDRQRSFLDLCHRMGTIVSPWCAGGVRRVSVTARGDELQDVCPTLARQCVVSVLSPHIDTRLNLVNAATAAKDRGITVESTNQSATSDFGESVVIEVEATDGSHQIEGTVFADGRPRILAIDHYRMEMVPERELVLIFNDDRPGVIGVVGTMFGDRRINIADMALSRRDRKALMVLKLDQLPDNDVLDRLRDADAILSVRTVSLPPLPEIKTT